MNGVLNYIINMQNGTFGRGMTDATAQVDKLDRMVNKVVATLATGFSIEKALSITHETTQIASDMQVMNNRIEAASKTQMAFAKNQSIVKAAIKDLRLPLVETTDAYSLYLASIKNTQLEGDKGNRVFMNMSIGAKAVNLDNERLSRGFNALNKMISTGNVQADEFKGMLAEAIPGAMDIARKAMGIKTPEEFSKQMEKGAINSIEFVQKFSEEFRKTYEDKLPNSLNSFSSKLTEGNNGLIERKRLLGEELMPVELGWINLQIQGIEIMSGAIGFYKEHAAAIDLIATAIIGGATAYYGMILANKAYVAWQTISYTWGIFMLGLQEATTMGLTGMTAAQYALNIAMAANPIGFIVTLLGAMVGALIYAYNHSENFRATLSGVWEVLKNVLEMMARIIALPFQILIDPRGALESIGKIKDLALTIGDDYTKGRASSFAESWKKTPSAANNPTQKLMDMVGGKGKTKGAGGTTAGKSGETGSGGKQIKNITLNFAKGIGEVKISTTNIQNISKTELAQILTDLVVGAAHDAEVMIGNNP